MCDEIDYGSFELQAEYAHRDRVREELNMKYNLEHVAKVEYSRFCLWCNCEKTILLPEGNGQIDRYRMKKEIYSDPKIFKEYLTKESFYSTLPAEMIKRKIGEKYFGYKYHMRKDGTWYAERVLK